LSESEGLGADNIEMNNLKKRKRVKKTDILDDVCFKLDKA
jgi:hypothetical protein